MISTIARITIVCDHTGAIAAQAYIAAESFAGTPEQNLNLSAEIQQAATLIVSQIEKHKKSFGVDKTIENMAARNSETLKKQEK